MGFKERMNENKEQIFHLKGFLLLNTKMRYIQISHLIFSGFGLFPRILILSASFLFPLPNLFSAFISLYLFFFSFSNLSFSSWLANLEYSLISNDLLWLASNSSLSVIFGTPAGGSNSSYLYTHVPEYPLEFL